MESSDEATSTRGLNMHIIVYPGHYYSHHEVDALKGVAAWLFLLSASTAEPRNCSTLQGQRQVYRLSELFQHGARL